MNIPQESAPLVSQPARNPVVSGSSITGRKVKGERARAVLYLAPALLFMALAVAAVLAAEARKPGETDSPANPPLAARVQSLNRVAEDKSTWGSLRWLMNAKLEPGSPLTLGVVELNVGQSNPLHVHSNSDEVIYVLSGRCEQRVGKETVILKAGDALRVPAGVPHQAKVLGHESLRSVVVYNTGERQFTVVTEEPK
ncbi:MAG TPA: cupin domain-containing protein [Candidatus Binatia bacterium]|jgi:quercetin dioxygenase-like cupin family protein|nr:cupin domain-containing protein [Candidatus Binatia bacterium]